MASSAAKTRADIAKAKRIRKYKIKRFFKRLFATLAVLSVLVAGVFLAYTLISENTYNKLSELGSFSVGEFIEVNIPKSYKAINIADTNKYNKNAELVVFSNKKCDLLFNLSDNLDFRSAEELSKELADGLQSSLKLEEVYHSVITTSDGLNVPIITFQVETLEGTRFFQYATINSGYKTILISMNSLSNNFKAFSKLISSLQLN